MKKTTHPMIHVIIISLLVSVYVTWRAYNRSKLRLCVM